MDKKNKPVVYIEKEGDKTPVTLEFVPEYDENGKIKQQEPKVLPYEGDEKSDIELL